MKKLYEVGFAVFNNMIIPCYAKENSPECDLYLIREDIGRCLGYKNPSKAISKIHKANYKRLNRFSLKIAGGITRLYSTRGVWELCICSKQPQVEDVMDFIWDIHHEWKGDVNND